MTKDTEDDPPREGVLEEDGLGVVLRAVGVLVVGADFLALGADLGADLGLGAGLGADLGLGAGLGAGLGRGGGRRTGGLLGGHQPAPLYGVALNQKHPATKIVKIALLLSFISARIARIANAVKVTMIVLS